MIQNKLTLYKDENIEYVLVKSTQEEVKEIEEFCKNKNLEEGLLKYPFIPYVYACGHFSEFTESDLKHIIPIYHTWRDKKEHTNGVTVVEEFVCYANKHRNPYILVNNIRIHEERLSSFQCALACLRAEYFYILRIYESDKDKFDAILINFKQDEQSSNNNNNPEICTTSESFGETTS